MKATVEVQTRQEAELIRSGLADPVTRAVVCIVGALKQLPNDHDRRAVLAFAIEQTKPKGPSDNGD